MKRRNYIKTAGIAAGVLASGVGGASAESTDDGSGAGGSGRITTADDLIALTQDELLDLPNSDVKRPFNPAIGGGKHYDADAFAGAEGYPHGGTVTSDDADYVVTSRSELQDALDQAGNGDVVWIPGDETIDATGPTASETSTYYGITPFIVPEGVTLASDRGQNGSPGGALVKERPDAAACVRIIGDNARVTGLRFIGTETEHWTYDERGVDGIYDFGNNQGIWIEGKATDWEADDALPEVDSVDDVEVDNCYFTGFTYNCIRAGGFADWLGSPPTNNLYIHHNEMVDTPSPGLGYGVNVIGEVDPLIEYNYFDNNRHAISATGRVGCRYHARSNLFGPRTRNHVIDMHEAGDSAGEGLVIERNVVLATKSGYTGTPQESVKVRGVPEDQAVVREKWFVNDRIAGLGDKRGSGETGNAIRQYTASGEFEDLVHYNNLYGKVHPVAAHGLDETRWRPNQADRGGN